MTKLDELGALARAATPGPWHPDPITPTEVCSERGYTVAKAYSTPAMDGRGICERTLDQAAFIAAMNPAQVLKLIEVIRVQREALEKVVGVLDMPIQAMAWKPMDIAEYRREFDEKVAREALSRAREVMGDG